MEKALLQNVIIEPEVLKNTSGTKIDFVYFDTKQKEWIVGGVFIKETLSQESINLLVREFDNFKVKCNPPVSETDNE